MIAVMAQRAHDAQERRHLPIEEQSAPDHLKRIYYLFGHGPDGRPHGTSTQDPASESVWQSVSETRMSGA
jgi:hypothetical protein